MTSKKRAFYVNAMTVLGTVGVPFLVGGAFALAPMAGVARRVKDLDLFVRPADRDRTLSALESAGYRAEVTAPHWLAKVFDRDRFIDVIYRSGNGISEVDDEWFAHAIESDILGVRVRLIPPEEGLWAKAFVMERERFDGADVAHILRALGPGLDWDRLLARFGPHWRVLLAHLVLFGFIYPSERHKVPDWVMRELMARLQAETEGPAPADPVCLGTLLSRAQYLPDVDVGGLEDGRAEPRGAMSVEEIALWTEAIARDGPR